MPLDLAPAQWEPLMILDTVRALPNVIQANAMRF
jgi:hypothetical protein